MNLLLHAANVESVAWLFLRNGLLSSFFFLLALRPRSGLPSEGGPISA